MPTELDEQRRKIMQLEIEESALKKETDNLSKERLADLQKELAEMRDTFNTQQAQWDNCLLYTSKVHNLFGYNMTRAAGEAFERIDPEKRFLMFSRSSYIGIHRYGGIWMGAVSYTHLI